MQSRVIHNLRSKASRLQKENQSLRQQLGLSVCKVSSFPLLDAFRNDWPFKRFPDSIELDRTSGSTATMDEIMNMDNMVLHAIDIELKTFWFMPVTDMNGSGSSLGTCAVDAEPFLDRGI
jgi:hypothetical protein